MFVAPNKEVGLCLLVAGLFCWGSWPALRRNCAVPVGAFAPINIASQFLNSILLSLTLGMISTSESNVRFTDALCDQPVDLRSGAVFLGGFLLGNGDHIGALVMEHIGSLSYPVYAGVALVGGNLFNLLQVGTPNLGLLLVGLSLILMAILCMAWAVRQKERDVGGGGEHEALLPVTGEDVTGEVSRREIKEPKKRKKKLTVHVALAMCVMAGCCGSGWSPLSTFARPAVKEGEDEYSDLHNPYVCLFIFVCGEVCAIPGVVLLGSKVNGGGLLDGFKELTFRKLLWGAGCGFLLNVGYLVYFASSVVVAPNVAFSIASCNPLLSIVIDWATGQFEGVALRTKVALAASVLLYGIAISVLSSIA
mmetsp:Transcript_13470/g.24775  ORF Transcript_13470/g.24775 Transcript_13470/m.24775 type:complete len:364 (-) Transcript_13470:54-1145(-)